MLKPAAGKNIPDTCTGNTMTTLYHVIYHWLLDIIRPLTLFFPDNLDIDEKRKRAMVVIGALAGIPTLLFFVYQDMMRNDRVGIVFDLGMAILFTTFLVFSRYVKNGIWFYRVIILGLAGVLMYNEYLGPTGDSSLIWFYIFPLAVFFVLGISEGICWYFLFTTISFLVLFFPEMTRAAVYTEDMRIRHVCAYGIITFLALCFEFLRWYFLEQLEQERIKLKEAMEHVRTLNGLVPICSICKKIRDDQGYWNHLEQYLLDHTDAKLSHGICDDCYAKHYPKEFARRKTKTLKVDKVEMSSEVDES